MFRTRDKIERKKEYVSIEQLVPGNHLLRKVDACIDFSFIVDKVRDLYCADNGRPCLDPVMLFKMLFIGYLFGIRSERKLVEEIEVNVAYRWFLGLSLTDPVPDSSTISQNRRRRFNGTTVFQEIFDEIVRQGMEAGLVGGKQLFTDSTHLKANANKNKFTSQQVKVSPPQYLEELECAVEKDRETQGKKH